MKKTLLGIAIAIMIAYVIFAFNKYPKENSLQICNDVNVTVSNNDTKTKYFIDASKIKEELIKNKLNPIGKKIADINTWDIEKYILENEHAKSAEVFFTNNHNIEIKIIEKKPIIRISPSMGTGYYLDENGSKMKLSDTYTAYVPIATGNISDSIILKEMFTFAKYLNENDFWNAQVDQIFVDQNKDIQIITRVGNQLVNIGDLENLETKLNRLVVFYKEGLNKFGWNKYSKINLKFKNQVVCVE